MFKFFIMSKTFRTYSQNVELALSDLFSGFPREVLSSIRKAVDVERMKQHYFKTGECPSGECAVLAARDIIGLAIAQMSAEERSAAWASIVSEDPTHPLHIATGIMLEHAKRLARDEYWNLLLCEIGGRLQGWSKQQIEAKWIEGLAANVTDALRRGSVG